MKKFLSTAVALGLVAGLAATASAYELKMDGKYQVDGFYFSSGNGAAVKTSALPTLGGVNTNGTLETNNDDWYEHDFRINPTFIVNDKVRFLLDIRLVDSNRVWGAQEDLQRFNGDGIRVNKAWLVYDSPVGKWEVGRRPAGAWMGNYINSSTAADRIMWRAPAMDNFKAYAFLQKSLETDGYNPADDDGDVDYYEVAGGYQGEGMKFWVGLGTLQDNTFTDSDFWRFKAYGEMSFGDTFSIDAEVDWKDGDTPTHDIQSSAAIIRGNGNFGELSAVLAYAYLSGDNTNDTELGAYSVSKGVGADFEPLYILTGSAANVLNGDRGANALGTRARQAGAHLVYATADFKTSEDLTLHGGLGWGQADEAGNNNLGMKIDDDYGFEIDLGLAYKVYANLTYQLHFGWWLVGDFAKEGVGVGSVEDIFMASHHLTMKF